MEACLESMRYRVDEKQLMHKWKLGIVLFLKGAELPKWQAWLREVKYLGMKKTITIIY